MHKEFLLIIPVYNEEASISRLIPEIKSHYKYDILAINDGSTDSSGTLLNKLEDKDFVVLHHKKNAGYGYSLVEGFKYSIKNNYKYAITIDCDLQHEPQFINSFLEQIGHYDVVSGSRYLQSFSANDTAPADRVNINRQITTLINQCTNLCITDAFCGFKAYRVSSLAKLQLTVAGYGLPLQIWMQAYYHRFRIKELAIPRIYASPNRTFGETLDNPTKRINYYRRILRRELKKWKPT